MSDKSVLKLNDTESEKSILGGLLKDISRIDKALLSISDKFFDNKLYRNLYKIVTKVYVKHGSLVTSDLISNYLESAGIPQDIRIKYLREVDALRSISCNDAEFAYALTSLKKSFITRSVVDILTGVTQTLESKGGVQALNILDKKLYDLKLDTSYSSSMSVIDVRKVDDLLDYFRDLREHPDKYRGIPSGWSVLDGLTAGFQKGEYILLIAKSGSGKSMGMLNWANNAWKLGYNTIYVSIEMPQIAIRQRQLSLESEIPFINIKTQNLTVDQLRKQEFILKNEIATRSGAFYVVDVPKCTVGLIEAQLRQLQQSIPIDIVFVDYLGLLKPESHVKGTQGWEKAAAISNDLRDLARTMKIPVIAAHQVTTEGMKKTAQDDLELEDIAISRRIADPADIVVGLIWDKMNPNEMKVCVPKCRGGMISSAKLHCNLDVCKISDMPNVIDATLSPPPTEELKEL